MEITSLAPIPAVAALVELIKNLGLPGKFAPLASIVLGIAAAWFLQGGETSQIFLQGLVIGLTASGLYSGGKALIKKSE